MPARWEVQQRHESPSVFHARELPVPAGRSVWVCDPTEVALVLGSAQRESIVDQVACQRSGVAVVRRRSGGGAVLVEPGGLLWVDVVIPADDPLWQADVGRAFHWLGEVWAAALADLGVEGAVHRGGLITSRWSGQVCFAGVGPGEVSDPAGAKLVGISQRRTRDAARFQCAALATWDPARLVDLLALDADDRAVATADLAGVAAGAGVDLDALLETFTAHLP